MCEYVVQYTFAQSTVNYTEENAVLADVKKISE